MRMSTLLAVGLAMSMAGCGEREPASSGSHPATDAPDPAVGGPDIDAFAPGDVVVSTNEPFFQARVVGGELVLGGVDVAERRLAVERSTGEGDTRTIIAGGVEVRVRDATCEDSMSGARFPFSAELIVDGRGPYPGCARPASMPPPGEPGVAAPDGDAALPAAFHGRWAPDPASCADPADIESIEISADAIRFHESTGIPRTVRPEDDGAVTVTFAYEGEGEQWEAEQRLRLADDGRLDLTGPEDLRLQRVRCP